nr:hypothetical protein B0A51_13992 [Rachicladosporium sp. CCFEE 5018]
MAETSYGLESNAEFWRRAALKRASEHANGSWWSRWWVDKQSPRQLPIVSIPLDSRYGKLIIVILQIFEHEQEAESSACAQAMVTTPNGKAVGPSAKGRLGLSEKKVQAWQALKSGGDTRRLTCRVVGHRRTTVI